MTRVNQHLTTATVDGRALGVFDSVDGGEVDSQESKYYPGGMMPQIALGGQQTISNLTLGRVNVLARDQDLIRWLQTRAGAGLAVVSRQPLDADGNPFGRPYIYRGVLKKVTLPPGDSNASSEAKWSIEVSTEGTVG